jgi:hypothetical protein
VQTYYHISGIENPHVHELAKNFYQLRRDGEGLLVPDKKKIILSPLYGI